MAGRISAPSEVMPQAIPHRDASQARIGWVAALGPRYLVDPSTLLLIAANLLPLYGVVFWHWDLYSLLVLYWMETGIIGFFAIFRIAMTAGLFAVFLVPFFILHFGGFMAGHILFLTVLFGGGGPDRLAQLPAAVWSVLVERGLWIVFVALFASHGISFLLNVWRPRRAARSAGGAPRAAAFKVPQSKDVQAEMVAPYGRIVVMHVTIVLGAFLIEAFRTKVAAFVLLIALKTVVDIAAHVRKNFSAVKLTTQ